MIALDTNILVYAHRSDAAWHAPAAACVRQLAEGRDPWAIPWPCVHELWAIVTHPRIYSPPTPIDRAISQIEAWLASPTLRLLHEGPTHWRTLSEMLRAGRIQGPKVHDARIAALCQQHGVSELWTADRDFGGIPGVRTRNPLIAGA